jgi:UDP-arabinose 4-epimerase
MKTVLVTGGAGYIGSHTCKALAQAGYVPVTYDNFVSGHRWAVNWGPLEEGDLADVDSLEAVITRYRPDAVLHFAAHIAAGESVSDPDKYYRNNVMGSLALLEAMRRAQVNHIVFSSTAAVYGDPQNIPITEDHPLRPLNPYGWSKLMIEQILRDFAAAYGCHVVSLRYFNAAGADPDGEIGEAHDPETHLIPLVLDAALGRRPEVKVFGDDYDTPDGTCIRDYIHVTDLAEAHVLALRRVLNSTGFESFNLGNGQGFSVREVIERARKVTGREIPGRLVGRREGDPPVLISDSVRSEEILRWKPQRAGIGTQITDAWRWHRQLYGSSSPGTGDGGRSAE